MKAVELTTGVFLSYFPETKFLLIYDPDSVSRPVIPVPEYTPQEFKKRNADRYGVYFSCNGFKDRRIKENVTRLNGCFGDFDIAKAGDGQTRKEKEIKKRELWKALVEGIFPPNIIITTSNGLQPIWLLKDAPLSEIETWSDTEHALIAWSQKHGAAGDKVYDVSRVLRLPEYYHHKQEPFLCRAFLIHKELIALQDLYQAYPYFDESKIASDNAMVFKELKSLDDIDMKDIALEALKDYGEPNAYFDKQERIVLARGVTGGYLGNDGQFIGSTSHELPAGNKITFVAKLLNLQDNKEAYKWIQDRFGTTTIKLSPLKPLSERNVVIGEEEKFLTGWPGLDDKIKNFRTSNTYLLSGLEKCGKSSFLMTMVNYWLSQKIKVGYLNTEIADEEFKNRLAANHYHLSFAEVEADSQHREAWLKECQDNFCYAGINDVVIKDYEVSFEAMIKHAENFVKAGAKIICFDNLSTIFTQVSGNNKKGWEVLASALARVINFSKQHHVCSLVVIHTRETKVFSETPEGMRHLLLAGTPDKIFDQSVTVVGKPTLSDVYAGGIAHSQLSGAILIWSPFQKYQGSLNRGKSLIIVDTFRLAPYSEIRMDFIGEEFRFVEVETRDGGDQE